MTQKELNQARIDEWDNDGLYDEVFRLKLTAKHALVVGKWGKDGVWGVDLRRWSYDLTRLLGEGITIDKTIWEHLYDIISDFYKKGLFSSNYGQIADTKYVKDVSIDKGFV